MNKAYNDDGTEIGAFDGRFVYSNSGKKKYWVEEGEVYSTPDRDGESYFPRQPCLEIGKFDGEVAINDRDEIIFTLNSREKETTAD